jgi:ADP-ribose pyrophosphatase YjhB (NUDIX family)
MGGLEIYSVSKAIIMVEGSPEQTYLMSIKRDPGSDNEGKLEFLGGRMEPGETPLETMVRELAEEESTGNLSSVVRDRANDHAKHQIGNALHFLFPLQISEAEYEELAHHPDESHGFRLITAEDLAPSPQHFTRKTNSIIQLLDFTLDS